VVIVEGLKAEQPNDRHGQRISILSGFSCSLGSLPGAIAKSLIFRHLLPAIMFYRKCGMTIEIGGKHDSLIT